MAISRNIVEDRTVPGTSMGPAGRGSVSFRMDRPQTFQKLQDMLRGGRDYPSPMPMPDKRFDFRRDMPNPVPMPSPMPPPGMGPFRQMPFPDIMPRGQRMPDFMDMNPGQEGFQMFAMPAAATIDPSDYRTIIKMIEQGLDPNDYMNRGGIASLLK